MSDINTNDGGQAFAVRANTSFEARRDISRSAQTVLETPTNEASNASAQVTATDRGNTGNRNTSTQQDPLDRAAEALQSLLPAEDIANTSLRIQIDEGSGRFVYQSIDNDSGEVVRQFPPEDLLRLLSNVRDVEGIAVDDEA